MCVRQGVDNPTNRTLSSLTAIVPLDYALVTVPLMSAVQSTHTTNAFSPPLCSRRVLSGLINVDFGLGTRLSTALRSSIKGAVRGEVDLEIKIQFTTNLRANLAAIVTKRCPKHNAACIRAQSKNIVKDAIKLTTKASAKISNKISTSLATKIRTAIDIQIKKFSINLWLIQIQVTGDVDVSNTVIFRFKATAGLCAKACADISLKQVADIRAICAE